MNKYHQEILEQIRKQAGERSEVYGSNYFGTKRISYKLTQPQARAIAKKWIKDHSDISLEDFILLLNSLCQGSSHDERTFGGKLLEYLPWLRKQLDPSLIDGWLNGAQGWWEVDSLCQMAFGNEEMLNNWKEWNKLFDKLVKDADVHKRRASLVLLTKPVRESNDSKLAEKAFENIDKLKCEKDILITKAISWLLRDLVKNHRNEVEMYLEKNSNSFPKIATRETKNKLLTGRKSKGKNI